MSDLLRKADVMNALCNRCIEDSEAIFCDYHFIKNLPAVDAVEVVRCKECEYQQSCTNAQYLGIEGFCSYGERKEVIECD